MKKLKYEKNMNHVLLLSLYECIQKL